MGGHFQALWEVLLSGSCHPIGGLSPVLSDCRGRPDLMVPYLAFRALPSLVSVPKTPSSPAQGTSQIFPYWPWGRRCCSLWAPIPLRSSPPHPTTDYTGLLLGITGPLPTQAMLSSLCVAGAPHSARSVCKGNGSNWRHHQKF